MSKKQDSTSTSIDDEDQSADVITKQPADVTVISGANADDQLSGKKVRLMIHPSQEDGGGDGVFVSVNGYAYHIPRNLPVEVPDEVAQVLKHAQVTIYRTEGKNTTESTSPRFATSVGSF